METSTQRLLARVKQAQGNCSDYRVAKLMNISHASVSLWNTGKGQMRPSHVVRACELAGERDAGRWQIFIESERERGPDGDYARAMRADFEALDRGETLSSERPLFAFTQGLMRLFDRGAVAIVAAVLGLALLANPYISRAATHAPGGYYAQSVYYVKWLMRWLRRLALLAAPLALAGCAALSQPAEMAWQAGNVVDAVQTDQMVTHGACIEGDPITRAEIGEKPSDGAVAVWALVGGAVHAGVSELLIHTNHPTLLKVWDGLTLADKWGTVARSFTLRGC